MLFLDNGREPFASRQMWLKAGRENDGTGLIDQAAMFVDERSGTMLPHGFVDMAVSDQSWKLADLLA